MTVAAIDAQPADVMIVAERNGLLTHHVGLRDIRRADPQTCGPGHAGKNEDTPKDRRLGEGVHAGVKNLRHRPGDVPSVEGANPSRNSTANG